MDHNLILDTDSYKAGHFRQYPPKTSKLIGYLESRGGDYPWTMFFGLQYLLKEYLSKPITKDDIEEASAFFAQHGEPFPRTGWEHILNKHGGYLPLRIKAVPEGTLVPTSNILLSAESTDEEVPWITGWLEPKIMRLWYPITVATRSFACKKTILGFLQKTADDPWGEISFKLHDFGARGVSSFESAAIGGAAHLVNFKGTDTIAAVQLIHRYYGPIPQGELAGYSIPAMEHSTVTAWGRDREEASYENMLDANPEYKLIAAVSDSYDIDRAVGEMWAGPRLLPKVKASGKTVVVRPDSEIPSVVDVRLLGILEHKVGMTLNTKGYKVLPPYFRMIQGDGNNSEKDIWQVLSAITDRNYSASNLAFGMGGGLLQKIDRDTQMFAFKLCRAIVNGEIRNVSKSPKGDSMKKSKEGDLDLRRTGHGDFNTVCKVGPGRYSGYYQGALLINEEGEYESELNTVFENGEILKTSSIDSIRSRAEVTLR